MIKDKKKMKRPLWHLVALAGVALFAAGFLFAAEPTGQATDVKQCAECHEDLAKAFMARPHAVIDSKGLAACMKASNSCTACHGNAEKHLEEAEKGNIFAFKAADSANQKSGKCLACHSGTNAGFFASAHGKAALDCTTCHVVHGKKTKPALLETGATKSCWGCHEDVFAQFQLNERHRLFEGILGCTTCHDPHEPGVRERLGGFKHEACLKCHPDKGGPFLYEHGASRIEGCSACHEVHGSPNRHMLTHQGVTDLCFSCHAGAPSWHSRFDSYSSNCTVCHSTIHGSNLSKIFLK